MLRSLATVAAVAAAAHSTTPAHHPVRHRPGCHTQRCDRHIDRWLAAYVRDHRPAEPTARAGASWYDDAGGTACGFHAKFGVASHYEGQPASAGIPCHTRLRMCYRRCATVEVQDRGPYVTGREIDLNPGAKAAIGFGDVGTVRYRVLR